MYRVEVGGTQYFAPDLATLQQWANEGRITPTTLVFSEADGQTVVARGVEGLVFAVNYSSPPTGQPTYQGGGSHASVSNNLILAIFSTLCCCLPFGIVSIIYAAQVDSCVSRGDIATAQGNSEKAKNWAIASIVCGLIADVAWIALSALDPSFFK